MVLNGIDNAIMLTKTTIIVVAKSVIFIFFISIPFLVLINSIGYLVSSFHYKTCWSIYAVSETRFICSLFYCCSGNRFL